MEVHYVGLTIYTRPTAPRQQLPVGVQLCQLSLGGGSASAIDSGSSVIAAGRMEHPQRSYAGLSIG